MHCRTTWLLGLVVGLLAVGGPLRSAPFLESELIFPPEHWHNHSSCVVECPNGDLLVCWYNGSGERRADDVKVEGARLRKGQKAWSPRFLLADTPGFPDTNPCLFIDPQKRLWLFWGTIVANDWHTAILKFKRAASYEGDGPPRWDAGDVILPKPGPDFDTLVRKHFDDLKARIEKLPPEQRERGLRFVEAWKARQADSLFTDKYFSRMGWMTRAHPFVLDGKRIILPLYSDGFSFSLMLVSDDGGETWTTGSPVISLGGIQPSIARKKDGTLVTYMRDNGPPPKRLIMSTSKDGGLTWSQAVDSELPNPGSGAEVLTLKDGRWVLIYNDTERGRHSLAVSLSDDEGKTWKHTRHLERDELGPDAGGYHYPSILQAKDGSLHATYTYSLHGKNVHKDAQGREMKECIKHAHFNLDWITAANP